MKKNVFQRLWEQILSLFPKQEIPEPKKEEPIPEEPKEVPPATEPEEEEEGIVSPWGINPVKAELSDIKSSSKLNGFISVDNINGYKVIHEHFHTISDMLKCFRRRENNMVMREEHESQEPEKDYTWYGTNSYEEAVKLLREGYVEILPRIKSEYKKNVHHNNRNCSLLSPLQQGTLRHQFLLLYHWTVSPDSTVYLPV